MLYQAHHVEAIKILLEEGVESLLALQDYDKYQHYEGELTEEEWREEEAQMRRRRRFNCFWKSAKGDLKRPMSLSC